MISNTVCKHTYVCTFKKKTAQLRKRAAYLPVVHGGHTCVSCATVKIQLAKMSCYQISYLVRTISGSKITDLNTLITKINCEISKIDRWHEKTKWKNLHCKLVGQWAWIQRKTITLMYWATFLQDSCWLAVIIYFSLFGSTANT